MLAVVMLSIIIMAACGSEPKTVEVIKEVEVEKIVEKIVEVEVEVDVEKIVEVEVEVEVEKIVEVEVEKIVTVLPPEGPKREIVFGGLNWDSALVQNGIARYIVEHGYGHETSQIEGATVPLFQGLRKGDIDITMEIWLPNQNVVWNEAVKAGEVLPVGKSLEDNWQSTFLIPGYVQAEYPDLDSVEDLKDDQYKALFSEPDSGGKAVLYGCIAGWSCRGVQEGTDAGPGQIEAYGLTDHVELRDPGTSGALAAAVQGAFTKKDPILFYYWGPTKLMLDLGYPTGVVDLDQPDPSECAGNDPVHGCAFPAAEVMIAMNTELVVDAPYLIPFFQNWDWSAGNQLVADGWYAENSADYGTAEEAFTGTAVWFLSNNDSWKSWVPEEVAGKVTAALANES
jgi:glycine betaine/proline transport system substrate-binding protein